ncbi:hypothetical protein [Nocardioides mesophilus]|uniref:Uncharacterized protein n=1 Tax=Nocardioides mesophilus TaxID=433659 RepID=A0A7G9R8I9_9ACTN|nr:hypothetical protein [Nocardioides mesophilus]QNN51914.1 hypothetical protein H9L09_15475 [Nocardioides mesophilus]
MSSASGGTPPAVRVRKHLMVPGQPRPQNREPMSIGGVQRWVLSTLAATTILHLAVGLIFAAAYSERLDAKIGLLVISAAFGVLAMVAALVIHRRQPLSPWLLIGLVPTAAGAWIVL